MMEYLSRRNKFIRGECYHFPSGYVMCENNYCCSSCAMAARIRRNKTDLPLFCDRDALRQTPAGGGQTFYRKPVILCPSAMDRLGLEPLLINQIMIATDGPGVFVKNVVGMIDGYLFCDPTKKISVIRSECYGIPTPGAAKKYDEYFFLGLLRFYKS